jgi:F0F1-type ATP synthase epsilon subunit
MKHQVSAKQFAIVARSPFHIYYEGMATALSAANRIGPFDILPGHADFFSILASGDVVIDVVAGTNSKAAIAAKVAEEEKAEAEGKVSETSNSDDDTVRFKISNGIIAVRDGKVMLFVNM